jgi:uncharacterized protein YceK
MRLIALLALLWLSGCRTVYVRVEGTGNRVHVETGQGTAVDAAAAMEGLPR